MVSDPFSASKRVKTANKEESLEKPQENAAVEVCEKPAAASKFSGHEFQEASNGKDWNFKIASWNINGVRAWIEVRRGAVNLWKCSSKCDPLYRVTRQEVKALNVKQKSHQPIHLQSKE